VRKSKDSEMVALRALQDDIAKSMAEMDKKLDMMRGEVRLRAERNRIRSAKAAKDRALAEDTLVITAEGEDLLERAKAMGDEANEYRAERARVQAEADSAEAAYVKLKIVSGVATAAAGEALRAATSPGRPSPRDGGVAAAAAAAAAVAATGSVIAGDTLASVAEGDEDGHLHPTPAYAEPEPDAVVMRIGQLNTDISTISAQCVDYRARLRALRSRHALLQAAKQPKARDAKDEADSDLTRMDTLSRRQVQGKRALEAVRLEGREAEHIKIQMQQSINILVRDVTC